MAIHLEQTTMADVAKITVGINSMVLEIESLRQMVAHKDAENKKLKEEYAKLEKATALKRAKPAQKGKASAPE